MKWLKDIGLALLVIFAPIKPMIIAAFSLVIVDLITGVIAAYKRGEPITSAGIKRSMGKIFLYEVGLCIAFIVQQYLTGDIFPASKLVSALVGVIELKSVLENLDSISGGNTFKTLIDKLTQSSNDITKGPPTP